MIVDEIFPDGPGRNVRTNVERVKIYPEKRLVNITYENGLTKAFDLDECNAKRFEISPEGTD